MYCAKCGAAMASGVSFCGKCGNPTVAGYALGQVNPIGFSPQPVNQSLAIGSPLAGFGGEKSGGIVQTTNRAIKSKVIIASITAAIVIAGILLYNMLLVTHPHDIVEKFFNAINEKDLHTAITCLDPQYEKLYNVSDKILGNAFGFGLKDVSDLLPFIFNLQNAQNNGSSDRLIELEKVVSETIAGDSAEVIVQVSEKDGNGNRIDGATGKINLKKFNEGWRIVGME